MATEMANFRQFRNQVTKTIQKSKFEHTQKLITQINTSNLTSKSWFKLAKELTQQHKKSNIIPSLIHNNVEASSDIAKCELLNEYFC